MHMTIKIVIIMTCNPHPHPQALSRALSSYPMLNALAAADATSMTYKVQEEENREHCMIMCIFLGIP